MRRHQLQATHLVVICQPHIHNHRALADERQRFVLVHLWLGMKNARLSNKPSGWAGQPLRATASINKQNLQGTALQGTARLHSPHLLQPFFVQISPHDGPDLVRCATAERPGRHDRAQV